MPIYEFACRDCRTIYSFFSRRVDTSSTPPCPRCGRALDRQVSLFRAGRASAASPDPLGLGDDGLDADFPDVPDFDPGDGRVAGAVAEMGDRLDRIDPNDTAGAAALVKEFSEKSGIKLNAKAMDALGKLAAGDDSEATQNQLAEAVEGGGLLAAAAAGGAGNAPPEQEAPFARDPALYDM